MFGRPSGGTSTSVKVYEQPTKQDSKRIVAEVIVQAPVTQVWRVLTDYESLPSFVPNLEKCERLPTSTQGRILLRQQGCSQSGLWRLEAEAILEVEEIQGPLGRREARFFMIKGDFKQLQGRWIVEPDPSSAVGMGTILRYEILVQPKLNVPSAIVSYVVRTGLPGNIRAIAERAEQMAAERLKASGLASWVGVEEELSLPLLLQDQSTFDDEENSGNNDLTALTSNVSPPISINASSENDLCPDSMNTAPSSAASNAAGAAMGSDTKNDVPPLMTYNREGLPTKGPFWSAGSPFAASAPLTAEQQRRRAQSAAARSAYLGTAWVPLPPSDTPPSSSLKDILDAQLEDKLQSSYPAFRISSSSSEYDSDTDAEDVVPRPPTSRTALAGNGNAEVHLRRLDSLDYLHRRAVASITVDAPAMLVWQVLTDYNKLAEFVPNLASSERIKLPPSAPKNIVRVRQVGYKRMLYMCLHAEAVIDLIEKPYNEIQFRQVAGDFERFQGKWMINEVNPLYDGTAISGADYYSDPEISNTMSNSPIEASLLSSMDADLGPGALQAASMTTAPPLESPPPMQSYNTNQSSQTQIKYAVEIIIPRSSTVLGIIEPLLEKVVFEDCPANLAAVKHRVESLYTEQRASALEEQGKTAQAAALRKRSSKPRLIDMIEDFAMLAGELDRCFGEERKIPPRNALRDMNRSDLEKAIAAHGGKSRVTERLGWEKKGKQRKPRGYWDSLTNVQQEIDDFIEEFGLQPGVVPVKNDFIRAGRFDLARAIERWGGLYEVAEELGYSVASPVLSSREWQEHISEVAAETGLSGKQGLFQLASKTYAGSGVSTSASNDSASNGGSGGSSSKKQQRSGSANMKRKKDYSKMPTVREEIDAW